MAIETFRRDRSTLKYYPINPYRLAEFERTAPTATTTVTVPPILHGCRMECRAEMSVVAAGEVTLTGNALLTRGDATKMGDRLTYEFP
jgi:hypothetical protein